MTMVPNVPPSMVRSEVMGGSGPFSVMVHGAAPQLNRIVLPAPPAALAARIAERRSPAVPEPAPGMPPLTAAVSSNRVTVNVDARRNAVEQSKTKAKKETSKRVGHRGARWKGHIKLIDGQEPSL